MTEPLEALANMEYPGRFIIIGQNPAGINLIAYGVTGRSPSSQARRLVAEKDGREVYVRPTDENIVNQGNRDLLIYPAIIARDNGIAVSNGAHTTDIVKNLSRTSPSHVLSQGLKDWIYEPDAPNFTPRIAACVKDGKRFATHIIKKGESEEPYTMNHSFTLNPGRGNLVATYTGVNQDPLPSFESHGLEVQIPWETAQAAVQGIYDVLAPEHPEKDFRVGVAVVFINGENVETKIINRHGDA